MNNAKFFKFNNEAHALRSLKTANDYLEAYRESARKRSDEENTYWLFVEVIALINLAVTQGDDDARDHWNKRLKELVAGFEPMAKKVARTYALQGMAMSYLNGKGWDYKRIAEALKHEQD